MVKIMFFILTLFGVSGQEISPGTTYVVFGEETSIEEFPFYADVLINGKFNCGSSILSQRWILTAAHCVHQHRGIVYGVRSLKVRIGGSLLKGGTLYQIDRLVVHPRYTRGESIYDFALMRLRRKLNYSSKVLPIALGNIEDIHIGAEATIVGRGISSEFKSSVFILRKGSEKVTEGSLCVQGFDDVEEDMFPLFLEATICTRSYYPLYQSSCFGDSGGPVVLNGKLVGVISQGSDTLTCTDAAKTWPPPAVRSLHASVPPAAAWIQYYTGVVRNTHSQN